MAVSNFYSYPSNSADADFRQWGLALSTALTAVGLTKTADTGQIDFTTVTRPLAVSTYQGYEVRAFTDSVGNPIYFKIEYGSASNTATTVGMRLTVGNGSNGSGTITGNTTTLTIAAANVNTSSSFGFASSNGGYLTFAMFSGNGAILISLGRTKSDAGADTSEGTNLVYQSSVASGTRSQTYLPANGGGAPSTIANFHCAAPPSGVGSQGNRLGVYPVFVSRGAADNFDLGSMVVFNLDFNSSQGNGMTVDIPFYGVTHRYIYIYPGTNISSLTINGNNGNAAYSSLLLRYE